MSKSSFSLSFSFCAALTAALALAFRCALFEPAPRAPEPAVSAAPAVSSAPPMPEPSASAEPPVPSESAAPAPAAIEPGVAPTDVPTRGTLPKAIVNARIEEAMPAVTACYTKALAKKPALAGQILVNFVVAPDGSVPYSAALEQGTTLPDDKVIDCVLGVFGKLHFPEPRGGRAVITYPLRFEPEPQSSGTAPE